MAKKKKSYKYKKGDKLVGLKGVFEVEDIIDREGLEGEEEEFYVLSPCIEKEKSNNLTVLFPVDSEKDVNKRKPLSRKRMKTLLRAVKYGRVTRKRPYSTTELKEMVFSNDPEKMKKALIGLKQEKKKREGDLSYSKRRVLQRAIGRLSEEVACSLRVQINTAKRKVLDALGEESDSDLANFE